MANDTSPRSAGRPAAALAAGLLALWLAPGAAPALQEDDEIAAARRSAVAKLAEAEAASAAGAATERHPDYVEATRRDGEITVVLIRARRLLETAKGALDSAERRSTRTAFADAGLVAAGALRELQSFERRTAKVLAEIAAERQPPPPPPAPPPPAEEPPVEAAPPPPSAPPRAPTPRRSSPPRKLIQAADAYFAGDYEGAVAILSATRFRGKKARAHLHLLLAASRYALFLLGGEEDYALRGEAIADVQACRAADPDLVPDEDLFSPRFRQFFAATE